MYCGQNINSAIENAQVNGSLILTITLYVHLRWMFSNFSLRAHFTKVRIRNKRFEKSRIFRSGLPKDFLVEDKKQEEEFHKAKKCVFFILQISIILWK